MLSIVAVPLILILTTLLLAQQFDETRSIRQQVDKSYVTRAQIQTVLSLHQDLETGQRGYILTGNADFLEPYREARQKVAPALDSLERSISQEPDFGSGFAEVRQLSREKLAFADEAVRLRQQVSLDASMRLIVTGRGKAIMDQLRARLRDLDAIEQRHLAEATADAEASRQRTKFLTLGLQALLLSLLVAAAWITHRAMRARRKDLDRLRDLSARQEAIFDATTDGMITHDPKGYIESLNPAAAAMYGYAPEELIGRHVEVLFADPPKPEHLELFLERLAGNKVSRSSHVQEFVGKRRDGSTFTTDVATSAVPLADGLHFVAVIRDVTERRRVEQMKTEFVSTVSHELRTPLTSIAGSLGLLAGGAAGALPERADKLIKIAHSNSERLVRLINDILDIEKIESGKMTFDIQEVPLKPLVEQAVQANRAFADGFGVNLELEPGGDEAVVLADPDRLTQVVTNLLSNAAKFSPRGETVSILLTPVGKMHRLTVTDKGPGIPEEFKNRIFSKFAQADASDTRQMGGTGLGLSIVKEIVSAFGGTISFETAEGRGTSFHVDLPAAKAAKAPKPQPASDEEAPDERPRILICQGEPDSAEQLRQSLQKTCCDTDVARSEEELRAFTAENVYAAILLDLSLLGEGSSRLIRELRSDPRHAATPILVASSEADGEVSQALSIADWLHRPLTPDRLVDEVGEAVARLPGDKPCILHVEDDPDVLRVVASAFEDKADLKSVMNIASARAALQARSYDLVILDLELPGGNGLDLLPEMRNEDGKPIPVVIFTARDSVPEVARQVEATLVKSRASLADLVETVESLVNRSSRRA
ncbi:CHASE3 domain-containing protein [Allosphingosinicella sp.]|uniref:CHASE3 domain-containing protein n=1 Tax=Allosphingosinicella sp. TaxID=2823234 RepID=UPI002EDBA244